MENKEFTIKALIAEILAMIVISLAAFTFTTMSPTTTVAAEHQQETETVADTAEDDDVEVTVTSDDHCKWVEDEDSLILQCISPVYGD